MDMAVGASPFFFSERAEGQPFEGVCQEVAAFWAQFILAVISFAVNADHFFNRFFFFTDIRPVICCLFSHGDNLLFHQVQLVRLAVREMFLLLKLYQYIFYRFGGKGDKWVNKYSFIAFDPNAG